MGHELVTGNAGDNGGAILWATPQIPRHNYENGFFLSPIDARIRKDRYFTARQVASTVGQATGRQWFLLGVFSKQSMNNSPSQDPNIFSRDEFAKLLDRPGMAPAMFLPADRALWIGGVYTLGKQAAPIRPGEFTGVRLQVPDPSNVNSSLGENVQGDLVRLIDSVVKLRAAENDLLPLVLSQEQVIKKDGSGVSRVRFGFICDPNSPYKDEIAAAIECRTQILRCFKRAGFAIESQPEFDSAKGFVGLKAWSRGVRLKKSWSPPWPLLLLLLFPFFLRGCSESDPIAGNTKSFIIVLDCSDSMQKEFSTVQQEARKTLGAITDSALNRVQGMFGSTYFVDLVYYDDNAISLFGELKPVTPATAKEVLEKIDELGAQTGSGTNLKSAIALVGNEIQRHGKATTLCIITDGLDSSVAKLTQEMQLNPDIVMAQFGMKPGDPPMVRANTLTPRLLNATEKDVAITPQTDDEKALDSFSKAYFGTFGFAGTAFGGRGMPLHHRIWNALLWIIRVAILVGLLAYLYQKIRTRN